MTDEDGENFQIICGCPIEILLGVPCAHIMAVLRKHLNEYSPKEKSNLIRINEYWKKYGKSKDEIMMTHK